ncbi:MAG: hypothetical protein NZ699_17620 [Roseiflexus sp.]|nr:hypothetical protein [Roseiflexus sp.]MCS7290943.1 hypothetical protein [Roseiflexus sp.]MDW8145318.1 hypothetical protein [Roseiflexaceae bacterium]MDW8233515.1 hypothetical protein [Roseiflexaceae bacterium]
MVRWMADEELTELLQRYYSGEGSLWPAIREHIAAELRRRGIEGARHIRFRRRGDGYEVIIEDASGYESE